ncbi:hypothetical protein LIER_13000 [Lithospermum erythrorhizon]|uniref:Reverse transcriptase zinc-binding domain-containing protein n=1 Tax=Lithospermum erythrorhizon TaxID=34254 RepID=A0AAV3PTV1_LITER
MLGDGLCDFWLDNWNPHGHLVPLPGNVYEEIRDSGDQSPITTAIWPSVIPKKISFLVWRLSRGLLPMNSVVQRRGLSLASKYVCCAQEENIHHVLFGNPIASRIWEYLAWLTLL